jgi:hypothetical protein
VIVTYTCIDTLILTIPRKGLTPAKAEVKLQRAAVKQGALPQPGVDDGGILGETDGPTLYVLHATRNVAKAQKAA